MPKKYDATTKYLLEADPATWVAYASLDSDGPSTVVSADLATVTAEADGVVRIDAPNPWLVHFEFQSGSDPILCDRLLRYNVLLGYRDRLPVQSVVILLRPQADHPDLTGVFRRRYADGRLYHEFHYLVVRAWEKPVEEILQGGLGTLPMAPLADVSPSELPVVIHRMEERIVREATPSRSAELWAATFVMMGLKYPDDLVAQFFRGARIMEDSSTYQAIVAKGKVQGERQIVLRMGTRRFGPPDKRVAAAIEALNDPGRIEALADRLLDASVTSWDDLLAVP